MPIEIIEMEEINKDKVVELTYKRVKLVDESLRYNLEIMSYDKEINILMGKMKKIQHKKQLLKDRQDDIKQELWRIDLKTHTYFKKEK